MRRRDRRELERLLEAATRAGTPEELQGLDAHRLRSPGRRLPPAAHPGHPAHPSHPGHPHGGRG